MATRIAVGGRTFAPVDLDALTARRDDWIQVRVIDAQLDKLPALIHEDDAAREILLRALRSGAKPHLLAGMFDEMDAAGRVLPWSPDVAEARAEFFACVTSQADRAALNEAFLGVLLGFFGVGLSSSASSPTSGSVSPNGSPNPPVPSPGSPASTSSATTTASTPTTPSAPDAAARSPRPRRKRETLAPTPSAPGHPSPA